MRWRAQSTPMIRMPPGRLRTHYASSWTPSQISSSVQRQGEGWSRFIARSQTESWSRSPGGQTETKDAGHGAFRQGRNARIHAVLCPPTSLSRPLRKPDRRANEAADNRYL